jgi:hypothetical protein
MRTCSMSLRMPNPSFELTRARTMPVPENLTTCTTFELCFLQHEAKKFDDTATLERIAKEFHRRSDDTDSLF